MSIKREFSPGDVAHLTSNKRMRGYILPMESPVTITGFKKINEKSGAYSYSIEVVNPKTNETEHYDEWFTQFDFYSNQMWQKNVQQKEILYKFGY